MIKLINYFLQAAFVYLFFFIGRILGLTLSRKLFSFLFFLAGPFFKSKKIIEKNLTIFSPNISVSDKNKIAKNMWRNYGMTFIEYIFLDYFWKKKFDIKVVGENNISDSVINNKQLIFISGHFANFELMSMEITKRNINLATIYRPLNNIFLNSFMVYLRKKYICKNQIKKGILGVKQTIEYIKKKIVLL